jgi:hypothetical protein
MKIENKVQANIISNNNEEAVKILIADYERKIKSLEKAKKEQQNRRESEMKMIEILLDEKKKLQEKINILNHKRFKALTQTSGQCHLLDYDILAYSKIKQACAISMSNVGVLEVTESVSNQIQNMYDK